MERWNLVCDKGTGFPKKDARFSKLKNNLLSDDKICKIKKNIYLKYLSNQASFMGNPVVNFCLLYTLLRVQYICYSKRAKYQKNRGRPLCYGQIAQTKLSLSIALYKKKRFALHF